MKHLPLFLFLMLGSIVGFSQGNPPAVTVQPPFGEQVCDGTIGYLALTAIRANTYQWYSASTGILANGAVYSGVTTNTLGINTTGSFGAGINFYCIIKNGFGQVQSNNGSITLISTPAPTGVPASACGPSAVTLGATGGTPGSYYWYDAAGNLVSGQGGGTYTTPVLTTTTTYYVMYFGACASPETAVTATINTIPAQPGASGGSACGPGSVTLTATGGTAGQYRWYTATGTLIAGQTAATYSTGVISATTNYSVAINNGFCQGASKGVTATINPLPAAPGASPGSSCGPGAITLTATGGAAGQYRWYTATGTLIAGQTAATYSTGVISTTTNYSVTINNGTCESTKTPVTATIYTIPAAPGASGGGSCGPGTVTLNATGGTAGQYRWYTAAGTLIAGQTNASYTTGTLSTTTNFSVSINNGNCEGAKTVATATIGTLPAAPGTNGSASCGPGSVTLTASGASSGQYRWYDAAGTLIAGQTNASYTTSVLSATTNFSVSINTGCEGTKTSVTATIYTLPAAPGASASPSCGSAAITINATGASAGQYRWYDGAGVQIAGQTNASYTTPVLASSANFSVSINNGTCEGPKTNITATINTPPQAPSATGAASCGAASLTLHASGASDGEYRWHTGDGVTIDGEDNSSYTTPVISASAQYFVTIFDGTCESLKTYVSAQIDPHPSAPAATGGSSCGSGTVTLTATGGQDGQFRWYTDGTTQTPIANAVNGSFTTPLLTTTTSFYVSVNNGGCESERAEVVATVTVPCSNAPPVISTQLSVTVPGGSVTVDLRDHISDPDNNVDYSSLTIVTPPKSGAAATIDANGNLILDYAGLAFAGKDQLTIQVCDLYKACTQQIFTIDVDGNIFVYTGISPNGDRQNDTWIIENIESLNDTKVNHVTLLDRWGDIVFEVDNYNNADKIFKGVNKGGVDVPTGVYFYKIVYTSGRQTDTGYLSVKR